MKYNFLVKVLDGECEIALRKLFSMGYKWRYYSKHPQEMTILQGDIYIIVEEHGITYVPERTLNALRSNNDRYPPELQHLLGFDVYELLNLDKVLKSEMNMDY